jgi:hypothetical protein
VTGSAIAIPLFAASGASAATGNTWDQVAQCESDGSWSADTGNGLYGGLQLSQEDWDSYGGLDYAPSPDQASRSQQIAVAEKILADQGVSAWPTCGPQAGLGKDSGSADVDTGVAGDGSSSSDSDDGSGLGLGLSNSSDSSSPSDSSDSSGSSEKSDSSSSGESAGNSGGKSTGSMADDSPDDADGKPTGSPSGKATDDSSEKSGNDSTAEDGSTGSGTGNGGSSADSSKDVELDDYGQSAGISVLVDTGSVDTTSDANTLVTDGTGRHRGVSAAEDGDDDSSKSASGRHASGDTGSADGSYTVRGGDTLASIADSLGLDGGWKVLYNANKSTIGSDPSLIRPGQSLVITE